MSGSEINRGQETTLCQELILELRTRAIQGGDLTDSEIELIIKGLRLLCGEDAESDYGAEDKTFRVNGDPFRCDCHCNVFRESLVEAGMYRCNSCGAVFHGE